MDSQPAEKNLPSELSNSKKAIPNHMDYPCFESCSSHDGYKIEPCLEDEIEEGLRNKCAEIRRGGCWHECLQGALSPIYQTIQDLES